MSFSCLKFGLKLLFEIYLKIEIEKHYFHLTGPSPPFRPISTAGPVLLLRAARRAPTPPSGPTWLPRPRPTPRRVSLSSARTRPTGSCIRCHVAPHAGDAGRVAPGGPSHARTRPSSRRPQHPAYLTPPFSSLPHSSNSRVALLRHRPRALAGDERFGHASPPSATTSSL
jgi:hypothetical protein